MYWNASALGKFKRTFSWTVNGLRLKSVNVIAEVIPIELQLSTNSVNLTFPADSLDKSCSEDIQLSNASNARAYYEFVSEASFTCKPDKGVVEVGQAIPITVIWTPVYGVPNSASIKLRIQGGTDQTLQVVGNLGPEPKAVFETKQLDFGIVAVGMENKIVARIKNSGSSSLVFRIDRVNESLGIHPSPDRGRIPPGDSFAIEVFVRPLKVASYENISIVAQIRGGKSVALKCSGQAVAPDVLILEETFHFGTVIYGSHQTVPFTIRNNSSVCTASMLLDFAEYPDFKPIFAKVPGIEVSELEGGLVDSLGNRIEDLSLRATPRSGQLQSRTNADGNGNGSSHPANAEFKVGGPLKSVMMSMKANKALAGGVFSRNDKTGTWQVVIAAGQTFHGELKFTPSRPKAYSFKLPLVLRGHGGNPVYRKNVIATCLPSALNVSELVVDFGDRVLSRDPSSKTSHYKEITLSNVDSSSSIRLWFEEDGNVVETDNNGESTPLFVLTPDKAELGLGQSIPLRITFTPSFNGYFEKVFKIFIDNQPEPSRPYLSLTCKGSGVFPKLEFSTLLVRFPSVPIGVVSKVEFLVISSGYDALELQYIFSPSITVPLQLEFPDGNEVGLTTGSVRVIASFMSSVATSFYGKIIFMDKSDERFTVDACGCVDNCLLTNCTFLREYRESCVLMGPEGMPVSLVSAKQLTASKDEENTKKDKDTSKALAKVDRRPSLPSRRASVSSTQASSKGGDAQSQSLIGELGIDLSRKAGPKFTDLECQVLLRWLNRFVCRRPFDATRFPCCCCENGSEIAIESIELMAGKKLTAPKKSGSEESAKKPATRTSSVDTHLGQLRLLLNLMIRNGALLSHVNPIFLLGRDDFLFASEMQLREDKERFTPAIFNERRSMWEGTWLEDCTQSWAEVLFQACKIYELSRANYKNYVKLPGIRHVDPQVKVEEETKKGGGQKGLQIPESFAGSNVMNENESVLLGWANYHMANARILPDGGASPNHRLQGPFRLVDFQNDAKDMYCFCQIVHSHIPELTMDGGPLFGYSSSQSSSKNKDYFGYLTASLQSSNLHFEVTYADLLASDRVMVLYLLYLYLSLPSMIPKGEIEFKGALNEPIVRLISLKNPSKRIMTYNSVLEGNPDFHISDSHISIAPESAVEFPVELVARFSERRTAKITFASVRENGIAGSVMVFKLYSNIVSRIPKGTVKRSVSLFEYRTIPIEVVNPFERSANFALKLVINFVPKSAEDMVRELTTGSKSSKHANPLILKRLSLLESGDDDEEISDIFKKPFWCVDDKVMIDASASKTITLHFLPFMMGEYSCQVVLSEPKVGEVRLYLLKIID